MSFVLCGGLYRFKLGAVQLTFNALGSYSLAKAFVYSLHSCTSWLNSVLKELYGKGLGIMLSQACNGNASTDIWNVVFGSFIPTMLCKKREAISGFFDPSS